MQFPSQILLNALIAGSIYALAASGFSLIYAASRVMHFGHGAAIGAGGYLLWFFHTDRGWPLWAALPFAALGATVVGYAVFRLLFDPLSRRKASSVILLIAGVTTLLLFQNLWMLLFGPRLKTIDLLPTRIFRIGDGSVTALQLLIIGASLAIFTILSIVLAKSAGGRRLRAVADDPDLAEITGISSRRVVGSAFLLGSLLAGFAGAALALERNVSPGMATPLLVNAFAGAVLGGLGSFPATIAGCLLLGLFESVCVWFFPSGFKDVFVFALLFAFLVFRPQGLFAAARRRV